MQRHRQRHGRRQADTKRQPNGQKETMRARCADRCHGRCIPGTGLDPTTLWHSWSGALNRGSCPSLPQSLVVVAQPDYAFSPLPWQQHAQTQSGNCSWRSGEWREMTRRTWWYCHCFRSRDIQSPLVRAKSSISFPAEYAIITSAIIGLQMLLSDQVIRPK